jgi:isopropylmalate/homocitrate/citramalate synthase
LAARLPLATATWRSIGVCSPAKWHAPDSFPAQKSIVAIAFRSPVSANVSPAAARTERAASSACPAELAKRRADRPRRDRRLPARRIRPTAGRRDPDRGGAREYGVHVRVTLCDVGPRDGLQNEPDVLPAATRAELVNRLAGCGLARIEAASFVRADRVPQMADAEGVAAALEPREGVEYAGLVLNLRGYERLRETRLGRVNCTVAATESFNRRNANMSLDQAVTQVMAILGVSELPTTATVGVAFGCPFEGRVDPGRVAELCERLDADEIVLADTIGVATPTRVRRLVERVQKGIRDVGVHLHNTRNTGYANAFAALDAGATVLDASVGGLGGCPFAPKATGNIATEDLVYLLEGEGVATGVDLDALIGVSEWLEGLLGHRLDGYVYRAGAWPG